MGKHGGGCLPQLATIVRAQSSCALVEIAAVAISVWGREMSVARTLMETPSHARETVASAVATHARRPVASAANPPLSRKVGGTRSPMIPSALSQTQMRNWEAHS